MPSSIDATAIIQGPCSLYVGAFGAAEPADGTWTALDPTVWASAGSTSGGVKLAAAMQYKDIEVDQVPDPIGTRLTGRTVGVSTTLSEITLNNIKYLMNGGVIAPGGGSTLGTVTIVASTGVLTVSAPHSLAVGDPVVLGAITSTTGISAGVVYYVLTVPSSTTLTLSATRGGTALTLTTNGSAASILKASYQSFVPVSSTAGFQPTYSALCLEGPVPGTNAAFLRRVFVRKVLSTGGFDVEYKKDVQQGLSAKWGAYYVTDTILPLRMIDQLS